ncbi:hypothetical protein FACS1894188_03550 [Clostridia bacterium]|nr:hypothetical protein FACS1894188_03550 [Clostridia bacterium]
MNCDIFIKHNERVVGTIYKRREVYSAQIADDSLKTGITLFHFSALEKNENLTTSISKTG